MREVTVLNRLPLHLPKYFYLLMSPFFQLVKIIKLRISLGPAGKEIFPAGAAKHTRGNNQLVAVLDC